MDDALNQLKQTASSTDESTRRQIARSLRRLADSMETPQNTIHRYGHLHLQTAVVKVGFDLGLFKYLSRSNGLVTVETISKETGADEIGRLLRYLAAIDAVDEGRGNQYCANQVTKNLSEKVVESGICHYFSTVGPQYQALPSYLEKTGHKSPTDEMHTAFQDAWSTPLHAFSWFAGQPRHLAYFNDYMALRRQPELSWLAVYPIEEEAKELHTQRPVYVNIGGGIGHQCAQFKEKYPNLPGRVILQDLPHSITKALPTPGVENMAHDIFEAQPVSDAKFYYLRAVLHDHPAHRIRKILENIKKAMSPDSVLLIDEMVLPDIGVNLEVASIDMTMLTTFASMERTEVEWREMFEEVGLRLVQTYMYNPLNYESVMDVRLLDN
ncbi:S-adenosyl-L-methionine-dependent methyltransferase [Hypoxylon crocopeplum]|nr:S-adenosyl-L-methionine-dependent methyltransferase [Hypoxylon crocopeplum]